LRKSSPRHKIRPLGTDEADIGTENTRFVRLPQMGQALMKARQFQLMAQEMRKVKRPRIEMQRATSRRRTRTMMMTTTMKMQ
jgi:hypothetical protein